MAKAVVWVFGAFIVLFIVLLIAGPRDSGASLEARKAECTRAVMSSIGVAKPMSYTDKQAYEAAVADKCKGFEINGKPVQP